MSGCKPNLFLDQIDTRHHFSNRMLHLNPGIDLHEVKVSFLIQKKLHRPDIAIVRSLDGFHRHSPDLSTKLVVDDRGWGFLDQLLMPPLDGAVTFPEMNHPALLISQDLHFDMARLQKIAFKIHPVVSKRRFGLGLSGLKGSSQVFGSIHDAHPTTSPTSRGFDDNRKADLLGSL